MAIYWVSWFFSWYQYSKNRSFYISALNLYSLTTKKITKEWQKWIIIVCVLRITEINHCFVLYTFRDIEDSLTDELHIYVNDEDHQSDVKQEKHSAVVKQ